MKCLLDLAALERGLKVLTGHTIFESGINGGTRCCMEEIPAFGLRLTSEFFRTGDWGVNLDGEAFAGIQELDEERKTGGGIGLVTRAKNLRAVIRPEFVEGFSFQLAIVHHALGLRPVDHFPEFSYRSAMRNLFSKKGLKAMTAPDAFHG